MDSVEHKLVELCQNNKNGITQEIIYENFPTVSKQDISGAINNLLAKQTFQLLRKKNGDPLFKFNNNKVQRLEGSDISPEEQQVYNTIQESSNQGIWVKDIRAKCNLHMNSVTKIVKKLEGKKIIKSFNSISGSTKKRYILFELTPDKALIGGAFYTEQQFDTELVEILIQLCYRFLETTASKAKEDYDPPALIQKYSYISINEALKYITDSNILKVKLTIEEVESVLNALVYDGKAEKSHTLEGDRVTAVYKVVHSFTTAPALSKVPCGVCPLIESCSDVGNITSPNCTYMKDWIGW